MPDGKYIEDNTGAYEEIQAIDVSTGASDADKIARTDSTGKFDSSLMPAGFGDDVKILPSFEALSAGDWVNVFDDSGTVKARKADATTQGKECTGFVLTAVGVGVNVSVFFEGINDQLSALTIGVDYFLSTTAGSETSTAPQASGNIVQNLGKSLSATEIAFEPSKPLKKA